MDLVFNLGSGVYIKESSMKEWLTDMEDFFSRVQINMKDNSRTGILKEMENIRLLIKQQFKEPG